MSWVSEMLAKMEQEQHVDEPEPEMDAEDFLPNEQPPETEEDARRLREQEMYEQQYQKEQALQKRQTKLEARTILERNQERAKITAHEKQRVALMHRINVGDEMINDILQTLKAEKEQSEYLVKAYESERRKRRIAETRNWGFAGL